MTSRQSDRRARWLAVVGAAAVSALTVTATATSTGASGESSTSEESSTSSSVEDTSTTDETSTTTGDSSSSTEVSTSSAPTGSSAPSSSAPDGSAPSLAAADFTAVLAAECEGDTGQPLLADALQAAVGSDGSNRIVEILRTCDVEFVGAIDPALGRPTTNVEALIADPANNVTPNQAQTDLLNAELALYWRIADAWAQSQLAATEVTSTTVAGAAPTAAPGSSVPGSDVSTSGPEESSTTAG
jgi:hypothetical protein